MLQAIVLFLLAGMAEIVGGYLIWLRLREGKPLYWGIFGGLAFGVVRCHRYLSVVSVIRPGVCCLWRGVYCSFRTMGMAR